jgi:hypothetical protein
MMCPSHNTGRDLNVASGWHSGKGKRLE